MNPNPWMRVAVLQAIPEAQLWPYSDADGRSWVVLRQGTELRAYYDRCSHQDVKLSDFAQIDGNSILCFAHGARFCAKTGAPLCFPGKDALWQAELKLESDVVYLRAPLELPD